MLVTQIKICGLSTPETLDAALDAGADFVGLVFYAPSPRCVTTEQAARLAKQSGPQTKRVGVFVDPDDALLRDAIEAGQLDALQLHRVTAARRGELSARFGLPIWAVLEVAAPRDLAALGHYQAFDRIIFDAKTPKNALPGGMGLSFDWSMLSGVHHIGPWGLAGGLSPANVAEAVRVTKAPLVDVSSGVESAPGVKDVVLIRAFCEAARSATL